MKIDAKSNTPVLNKIFRTAIPLTRGHWQQKRREEKGREEKRRGSN
jgi:hypothetical protein